MQPTLQPGDYLSVQGTAVGSVHAGDIIVLRNNDQWWVHRVLRISQQGGIWRILTKGDNRLAVDPIWELQKTVARVVRIQRGSHSLEINGWRSNYGGRLIAFLSALQISCSGSPMIIWQRAIYKTTLIMIKVASNLFFQVG